MGVAKRVLTRAVEDYGRLLYGKRSLGRRIDPQVNQQLLPRLPALALKIQPALLPPILKIAIRGGAGPLLRFATLNVNSVAKLIQLQARGKPTHAIREKIPPPRRVLPPANWLPDSKGTMTHYERFNAAVDRKEPDRVPLALLMDYFYARMARLTPKQFINSGYRQIFKAVRYTHDLFGDWFDLAHVPMGAIYSYFEPIPAAHSAFYSPLVPDDKLGGILQFVETPVVDVKDFPRVQREGFSTIWRPLPIPKVIQTMTDILALAPYVSYWERKRKVPLYSASGMVTPLEVLSYLMGMSRWARGMLKHRDEMKQMCDWMFAGQQGYDLFLKMLGGVPRAYICLERASPRFLRPQVFEDLVWPYLTRIVAQNNRLGLTNLFHMDTDWGPFLPLFATLPRNGKYIFHLEDTDIRKAKDVVGHLGGVMGNLPTRVSVFGTPTQVEDACKKLIKDVGSGGGFLLSCGCHLPEDTPIRNVVAMIRAIHKHGTYRK